MKLNILLKSPQIRTVYLLCPSCWTVSSLIRAIKHRSFCFLTDCICSMPVNLRSHQLHGVFRSELFHHGMKLFVPFVWRSIAFLTRRRWRGRSFLIDAHPLTLFQQEDRPLHQGEALPTEGQRTVCWTPLLSRHWESFCYEFKQMTIQRQQKYTFTFSEALLSSEGFHS